MMICSACGHALTPDGPCGFASVTVGEKTTWLCHGDDHSCYVGAAADPGKVTSAGREIEQRALGNAIDALAIIAGIVKLAQHEPRKDAWRSIDAIADILDALRGEQS